ncbi:MAG: BglG family transcription antiterminator [Olsenella sp.]|nr:BglG family transcription antiterminator [Olsenella sp.]
MAVRALDIIQIVQKQPGITQTELAKSLDVSQRTIRSGVRHANDFLGSTAHIVHHRNDGYELIIDDAMAFAATGATESFFVDSLPSEPEERVGYLLSNLVQRDDWVTLDDLSAQLFVSRASVSADLRTVEKILSRYGLKIARRPRYGIRVEGSEMARRLCIAGMVLDGATNSDDILPSLEKVSSCTREALDYTKFKINSDAYHNLVVHVAVSMRRIAAGDVIGVPSEDLNRLKETSAYYAASRIAMNLADNFETEIPEQEVAYLAMHLIGRQFIDDEASEDMGLIISDEIWSVVGTMLAIVRGAFGVDFGGDLELRMNLARHLVPLSVRLKYRMRVQNPLLDEIIEHYPLAWSMARATASVLEKAYGTYPSDEEIGYIALTFALALERKRDVPARKNIVVVCGSGQGVARMLEWRFREDFGPWLNSIKTCDASEISALDFTNIDYVFTTVPLSFIPPVPVRRVNTFLDETDVKRVRSTLEGSDDCYSPIDYFDVNLFFPHLAFSKKDEVLDFLCKQIESQRTIHGNLRELVEERERLAETSFGNQVAMPHPYEPVADETFVCVGLLDEALLWDSHPVRAVFLVCITREDVALDGFYRVLTPVLSSEDSVERLVEHQDWSTLCSLLQESASQGGDDTA